MQKEKGDLRNKEACSSCAIQLRCLWHGSPSVLDLESLNYVCHCGYGRRTYIYDRDCIKAIIHIICPACDRSIPLYGIGSIKKRMAFYAKSKKRAKR